MTQLDWHVNTTLARLRVVLTQGHPPQEHDSILVVQVTTFQYFSYFE